MPREEVTFFSSLDFYIKCSVGGVIHSEIHWRSGSCNKTENFFLIFKSEMNESSISHNATEQEESNLNI